MWREALPSGNGPIAAAVYGAVNDETVLLTHEDLWHGVKTQELPDVSGKLSEVRELLFSGNPRAADRILADELKRLGYEPNIGSPLPLGDLKIRMPVCKGFRKYRRSLDMETGEVSVCWEDDGVAYSRKLFVSRTGDLVVMEIRRGRAHRCRCDAGFARPIRCAIMDHRECHAASGRGEARGGFRDHPVCGAQ